MKKLITFIVLSMPSIALAASDAHALDWKGLGWRVFIFVIFAALMYRILKKPIINMVINRGVAIEKALNEALIAKKEAEEQVRLYESKMVELQNELLKMKEDAHKMAEKERLIMLSDAERIANAMKDSAKKMILAETEKAKFELRNEVVALALQEAEKHIVKDAESSNSKEITAEYIKRIGANI